MRTKEIIKALQDKGFKVTYYTAPSKATSDGKKSTTTRITGIYGYGIDAKFKTSSPEGNKLARTLAGAPLSKKQLKQRQVNVKRIKGNILTASQEKKLKALNKVQKAKGKETYKKRSLKKRIQKYGWRNSSKAINNIARHTKGIAYRANIENLIDVLDKSQLQSGKQRYSFPKVTQYLARHIESLPDEIIPEINRIRYKWQKGEISSEQAEEEMMKAIKAKVSYLKLVNKIFEKPRRE